MDETLVATIKIERSCSTVMVFKTVPSYDALKKYVCASLGHAKRHGFAFY